MVMRQAPPVGQDLLPGRVLGGEEQDEAVSDTAGR